MTRLYRWRAELDLPAALSTLPDGAVVMVETPADRPVVGRWLADQRQLADIQPDGTDHGEARGRLRHRTAAELAAAGAYAVRGFTEQRDLHWRGPGLAVWLSEHAFRVEWPAAAGDPIDVERTDRRILRRGGPVPHVPVPGWSAWADAEVGVVWYPIAGATRPADPIAVLRVADYATGVADGPAAGCVAPLTTRWLAWEAVPRDHVMLPP